MYNIISPVLQQWEVPVRLTLVFVCRTNSLLINFTQFMLFQSLPSGSKVWKVHLLYAAIKHVIGGFSYDIPRQSIYRHF